VKWILGGGNCHPERLPRTKMKEQEEKKRIEEENAPKEGEKRASRGKPQFLNLMGGEEMRKVDRGANW